MDHYCVHGKAEELIVTYAHPLFLKAHSAASKADNPSWREATRGKFAGEYSKEMKLEIATLEAIDAWSVIDHLDHHVIASTWVFKCKRYPDGLIKKLRAQFCARGDKKLEGTDFFDTYANDPQDIESLGGEGELFGRVPGRPQVGTANRSQGQAHDGPGQDQGRPLGDQCLPLERRGQAQACGGLGQAQGGQVPRSARQAPGLLGMLGCNSSHVSLAASAASASLIPISGYFGMIKHITRTR